MSNVNCDLHYRIKEMIIMLQPAQPIVQSGQQSNAPMQNEHVVVAGETVEQIAGIHGVPAKYVRQLNKLSGPVQPGQKLRIPMARAAAASASRSATSAKTMPAQTPSVPAGTTHAGTK
jgi:LysM repeat protein